MKLAVYKHSKIYCKLQMGISKTYIWNTQLMDGLPIQLDICKLLCDLWLHILQIYHKGWHLDKDFYTDTESKLCHLGIQSHGHILLFLLKRSVTNYTRSHLANNLIQACNRMQLTWYTSGERVTLCARRTIATCLVVWYRTPGTRTARIFLNTWIDTSPISTCLTESTLIIWWTTSLYWGSWKMKNNNQSIFPAFWIATIQTNWEILTDRSTMLISFSSESG